MADIMMPQLGETVTEGTVTRWFKQVGDEVALDEALFEVSTDKVDTEVPSPVAGVLSEIPGQRGGRGGGGPGAGPGRLRGGRRGAGTAATRARARTSRARAASAPGPNKPRPSRQRPGPNKPRPSRPLLSRLPPQHPRQRLLPSRRAGPGAFSGGSPADRGERDRPGHHHRHRPSGPDNPLRCRAGHPGSCERAGRRGRGGARNCSGRAPADRTCTG